MEGMQPSKMSSAASSTGVTGSQLEKLYFGPLSAAAAFAADIGDTFGDLHQSSAIPASVATFNEDDIDVDDGSDQSDGADSEESGSRSDLIRRNNAPEGESLEFHNNSSVGSVVDQTGIVSHMQQHSYVHSLSQSQLFPQVRSFSQKNSAAAAARMLSPGSAHMSPTQKMHRGSSALSSPASGAGMAKFTGVTNLRVDEAQSGVAKEKSGSSAIDVLAKISTQVGSGGSGRKRKALSRVMPTDANAAAAAVAAAAADPAAVAAVAAVASLSSQSVGSLSHRKTMNKRPKISESPVNSKHPQSGYPHAHVHSPLSAHVNAEISVNSAEFQAGFKPQAINSSNRVYKADSGVHDFSEPHQRSTLSSGLKPLSPLASSSSSSSSSSSALASPSIHSDSNRSSRAVTFGKKTEGSLHRISKQEPSSNNVQKNADKTPSFRALKGRFIRQIEASCIDKRKLTEALAKKYVPELLDHGCGTANMKKRLRASKMRKTALKKGNKDYEKVRKDLSDMIRSLDVEPHILLRDLCSDLKVPIHLLSDVIESIARFIRGSNRGGISEKIRQAKQILCTLLFLPDLKAKNMNGKVQSAQASQSLPSSSKDSRSDSGIISGVDNSQSKPGLNFSAPSVETCIFDLGLDTRSHAPLLSKARTRAHAYILDPKSKSFFEPRSRRVDATSKNITDHAKKFYKDVSTKIRGESKCGRFRMDISIKEAHAKWLTLAKLAKTSGGLGQEESFQRSLTWFRKIKPKDVLVPITPGGAPMNRGWQNRNNSIKHKFGQMSQNNAKEAGDADSVVAEASISSSSGGSAVLEPGHGLVDPIVPPPKWL